MMDEKKVVPKRRFKGFDHEWKSTELGAIGSTFSGLSGKTKKDFGHGTAEFVTYMNVFNNSISNLNITEKVVRDDKQTQLKYGDILFTTSSETPNEVGMSSVWLDNRPNVYLNSFCFGLRPSKDIDYFFIAYLLRANLFRKQMEVLAQGISRYNISKSRVMEIKVNLPSLKEQQKIGEFFKVLDDRIANQERKIAKVKALKTAYLTEMFPQEGETVPKRRFNRFEEEWNKRRLSDLGEILTGSTPPTNKPEYYSNEGVPWVTPTDIKGNITLVTDKHISEAGQKVARVVPENTILVTSIASIGKNTILGTSGSFNQQINGLIPNQNENNPYFLYVASTLWSIELANKAASGTMQIVNKTEFSNLKVMIPSLAEQQKIGSFFKNLDDQITTEEKKLEKLKKMKEAYLEEMFV